MNARQKLAKWYLDDLTEIPALLFLSCYMATWSDLFATAFLEY